MVRRALSGVALGLVLTSRVAAQPAESQAPASPPRASNKVDIVSVTGCLREPTPNVWMLTAATDPATSTANAPAAKDIPSTPPAGKNEFRLIGVSEFNLSAHKGHTVIVKGLYIKAAPVSRLNITSVTMVSASCAPGAEKNE